LLNYILPLVGGVLIGLAASLMLLWNGRVTGVSGIVSEALWSNGAERNWRLSFVGGLLCGGALLKILLPGAFIDSSTRGIGATVAAGVLVGFGTVMGSGCTSGHGICGISRLSPRSIVATLVFIAFGIASATLFRNFIVSAQ
jgi:uncharacterized membrane protein YedE/YeeE